MAAFAATFTGAGQKTAVVLVRPGDSVTYTLTSAGMTGTYVFEHSVVPGDNFVIAATTTVVISSAVTWNNDTGYSQYVRLRAVAHSGSDVVATVTEANTVDQNAALVKGVIEVDGLDVFKVVEGGIQMDGTLTVSGALTASGLVSSGGDVIGDQGAFGIAAVVTDAQVSVEAADTTGTTQKAIEATGSAAAAATTALYGVYSDISNLASAHTCALRAQVATAVSTKGAGSTITSDVGVKVAVPTQGAENIGVLVGAAPAGSNTFAAYFATNAFAVAAGPVMIGQGGAGIDSSSEVKISPYSTSGTTQRLVYATGAPGAQATTALYGFHSAAQVINETHTCAMRAQFYSTDITSGANPTITSDVGVGVEMPTHGTENIGVLVGSAPAGSKNYGVYVDSPVSYFGGGLRTKLSQANTANPPADAELDSAFGTPGTVGGAWIGVLDDAGGGANAYLVFSDGSNWWTVAGTKAV